MRLFPIFNSFRPSFDSIKQATQAKLLKELHEATIEYHTAMSKAEDYNADAMALRARSVQAAQQAETSTQLSAVLKARIERLERSLSGQGR
jgi:hypothetical protein